MTRDILVSKSVSQCRHYTFSRAAAGVKGGLSSCRAGEYSGFLTDGGDVYDIHPLKSARVVGEEERRQSPWHHHLIRKTRNQI